MTHTKFVLEDPTKELGFFDFKIYGVCIDDIEKVYLDLNGYMHKCNYIYKDDIINVLEFNNELPLLVGLLKVPCSINIITNKFYKQTPSLKYKTQKFCDILVDHMHKEGVVVQYESFKLRYHHQYIIHLENDVSNESDIVPHVINRIFQTC